MDRYDGKLMPHVQFTVNTVFVIFVQEVSLTSSFFTSSSVGGKDERGSGASFELIP